MERELEVFIQRINADIRDRLSSDLEAGGGVYSENIFSEMMFEYLSEVGMIENPELCHYEGTIGRGITKINGFAFNDDESQLDLYSCILINNSDGANVPKEEVTKAASRALRFFEAAERGSHDRMEPSDLATQLASRIHKLAVKLERIRIFVITNGLANTKEIEEKEVAGIPVRFELWDIERLFRSMQGGLPRDEIDIDFEDSYGQALPCLPMPEEAPDYTAYLAIIPGNILYDLYDEYGPRLLELNVRSFLSARGKVNSGIRKTLKEEPDRFMAYNNGIVVTVDSLEMSELPGGAPAIKSVKGLQIVNGGQTTASIHRARKTDKAEVDSVFIPAKITVIRSDKLDEIVQMISHYANMQNTIQPADFSANDPFHVEIERLSTVTWCPDHQGRWFYERARGQYQVAKAKEGTTKARVRKFNVRTPPARKLTKTDLAKYVNTWDQRPHMVSFGAQKNFNYFMQNLRNGRASDWLPDEKYYRQLIAKAILFKAMQKIVRREQYPAHQANITTYTLSYLSWKTAGNLDLEGIWKRQGISDQLSELLKVWSHVMDEYLRKTAKGRMVTEWAKKEACWDSVKKMGLELPEEMPEEMAGRTVVRGTDSGTEEHEQLSPEDYRNIEVCKSIDGQAWLQIHAWGKKTGSLQKWQIGIAHTLAGYAASDWERGPSPKQAKHGAAMVGLANDNGVFDS